MHHTKKSEEEGWNQLAAFQTKGPSFLRRDCSVSLSSRRKGKPFNLVDQVVGSLRPVAVLLKTSLSVLGQA